MLPEGVAVLSKSDDGVVITSDFIVESAYLIGDGTNNGLALIYNGLDTDGKLFGALRVAAHGVSSISYGDGHKISGGIYLDVTTVGYVLIIGHYI